MKKFISLIILITIVILWVAYTKYSNFEDEIIVEDKIILEIESWDNLKTLSKKIGANYYFLKKYINKSSPESKLNIWSYDIKENSKIEDIINSLENPINDEVDITILEWWNIYDIDLILSSRWVISKWDYISYVNSSEKISKLSEFFPFVENLETLEGFLYPDTYKISRINFKVNNFVIKQLETFEKKVYKKILVPMELTEKQVIDVINLASIVEKEEKVSKRKSIVAGILKKRFRENWFIGADATVCYPYKLTSEECKLVVSKYILDKNDYNTRTKLGLPKTPISNPSAETVKATLHDKKTPYYFYLHDKNWNIHYAITNNDHVRNKNKYLR